VAKAKAKVSKASYRKALRQRIDGGDGEIHPAHSFRTLLGRSGDADPQHGLLPRTKDADRPDHRDESAALDVQLAGGPIGSDVDCVPSDLIVISMACVGNTVKFGLTLLHAHLGDIGRPLASKCPSGSFASH
jgi:hypothetical protein